MAKIHVITQGCSANANDSEIMMGALKGVHEFTRSESEADIIIFNTCTVKGPTESFFHRKMRDFKDKKVVIAGCIPQSQPLKDYPHASLIGTSQVGKIASVVERTLKGERVKELKRENTSKVLFPTVRKNPLVEIVQILQGCKSSCSFCKTKQARGNLFSYPAKDIVRRISKAVEAGVKEVWLTSQDNSVYGLDQGSNLAELLKAIVSIPREFKVRVGMANPNYFHPYLDELIEVFKSPKIYKFLHVPVQSGSDKVLKDMRRDHGVQEYRDLVRRFREVFPDITIATDIIVGFPTETEEEFQKTLSLIKETRPRVMNISRFWPRPGTPAARLKQLDGALVKERTRRLNKIFQSQALAENEGRVGWEGEVLVCERGKEGSFMARDDSYRAVVVKSDKDLLGERVRVRAVDCAWHDLRAITL